MIPAPFADALHEIVHRLADFNYPWVLTGSLGFAVQGLAYTPKDIDLQTTTPGAYALAKALRLETLRPLSFREGPRIRSTYGRFILNKVVVEIMGDVQHALPTGEWSEPVDIQTLRKYSDFGGSSIPVLPLDYEALAYARMGRETKAAELRNWLEEHGEK